MPDENNRNTVLFKAVLPGTGGKFSEKRIRTAEAKVWARRRKMMLYELANLRDDSCGRFRRSFGEVLTSNDDDGKIFRYRDDLRKLWRGGGEKRSAVLFLWLLDSQQDPRGTWNLVAWADGTYSVEPNCLLLPLALAIGAGEWMRKMEVCSNPDCPTPYFLKIRRTQRFCNREICAAYGQRQHKLGWWKRVGAKRREKWCKIQSKPNRKERKRA